VQGRLRLDELALGRLELDREHLARVALRQERPEGRVHLERVRGRHELRDQVRRPVCGGEHAPPLGGVHGHARLAEDVLARLERGHRDRAVHGGPGADADGVDVTGPHEVAPVLIHPGELELARDALAGLLRPVRDGHQLDARLLLEPRDVPAAGVVARAHEPHADRPLGHGATW